MTYPEPEAGLSYWESEPLSNKDKNILYNSRFKYFKHFTKLWLAQTSQKINDDITNGKAK